MKNNTKLALGIALQLVGLALAEAILYVPISVLYLLDLLEWEYTWSMLIPLGPAVAGIICFLVWFLRYKKKIRSMEIMDFAFKNYHVPTNLLITLGIQIVAGIAVELLAIGIFDPMIILPMLPYTILSSAVGMVFFDILAFSFCQPRAN